ncbi:MAG: hypothetical protein HAW66_06145 [Shewanella sp.]|nr:hypothetical protein [Shewanella sp.]
MNSSEVLKSYADKKIKEHIGSFESDLHYDALCLSGGGARGVAYCGVLRQLGNDRLINDIKEISGSSIGAIFAIPIAFGMTVEQISTFFSEFPAEISANSITSNVQAAIKICLGKYVLEIQNFLKKHNIPLVDQYGNKLDTVEIETALNYLTFEQHELLRTHTSKSELPQIFKLKLKRLVIVATFDKKEEIELSSKCSPNMAIATAVRGSCGFPYKIGGVKVQTKVFDTRSSTFSAGLKKTVSLTDGGITNNTPYIYIKGERKLVIAFTTADKRMKESKFSFSEFLMQTLVGAPVYKFERFDIKAAKADPKVILFLLDSYISTFDLKKAKSDFYLLMLNAMKQFAEFEQGRGICLESYLPSDSLSNLDRVANEIDLSAEQAGIDDSGEEANLDQLMQSSSSDYESSDLCGSYDIEDRTTLNGFKRRFPPTLALSISPPSASPISSPSSDTSHSITPKAVTPSGIDSLTIPRMKKATSDDGFDFLKSHSRPDILVYKKDKYGKTIKRPASAGVK